MAAGSGDTAVSAVLSALACNTTYHYRASASNANGTTPGDDQSFTTSACLPGAPTIGAATAGVGRATVAFTPPANDGGAAITSYAVTCEPGGITASGSASPITVTGLSSGQAYTCSVTATNSAGTGPASAAVSVTPLLPAPVPTLSQWGLLLLGGLLGATALRRRAARG
ncbi:MAG: fibronectin type III domain-containing protein [Ottowia sp.]|nr:fibronectin type III domain-containing protein [Ottowia sp.]